MAMLLLLVVQVLVLDLLAALDLVSPSREVEAEKRRERTILVHAAVDSSSRSVACLFSDSRRWHLPTPMIEEDEEEEEQGEEEGEVLIQSGTNGLMASISMIMIDKCRHVVCDCILLVRNCSR